MDSFFALPLAREVRSLQLYFLCRDYRDSGPEKDDIIEIFGRVCSKLQQLESLREMELTATVECGFGSTKAEEWKTQIGSDMAKMLRSLKLFRERGVKVKVGLVECLKEKLSDAETQEYLCEAMGEEAVTQGTNNEEVPNA